MQPPNNVQNRADTVFGIVDTLQDAYFALHGKYFQSLRVGTGAYTDSVPPDEPFPSSRQLVINGNNPFEMEIHESVGPSGASYSLNVYYNNGGTPTTCSFFKGGNSGWSTVIPNNL